MVDSQSLEMNLGQLKNNTLFNQISGYKSDIISSAFTSIENFVGKMIGIEKKNTEMIENLSVCKEYFNKKSKGEKVYNYMS